MASTENLVSLNKWRVSTPMPGPISSTPLVTGNKLAVILQAMF